MGEKSQNMEAKLIMTPTKPLTHYREQARLATRERMRAALECIVVMADLQPSCSVGHLIEHGNTQAREILKETEGL